VSTVFCCNLSLEPSVKAALGHEESRTKYGLCTRSPPGMPRILAGTVVELCKPLQHRRIERGRFAMREHTIDVDDD
jgi:hypothetical protein